MEKNYISQENFQNEYSELIRKKSEVPNNLFRIMVKFGLPTAISIGINRLRFRVKCRVLYNIDLLRTLQTNLYRLNASRVTVWMIRRSITSRFWSNLLYRIENHYRKDYSVNFTKVRNSDVKKLFSSLYKQSKI